MFLKNIVNMKLFCIILFVLAALSITPLYACDSDDEVEKITKTLKNTKISHPVTLARASGGSLMVSYTQQLINKGKKLNLKRPSTKKAIQCVWGASVQDGYVTHLLAQGVCKGVTKTWPDPFTADCGFPGIATTSSKKIDWVSNDSKALSNDSCYIRKPQTNYWGGHAEPQLISDLDALFTQDSNAVVKLFTPPPEDTGNVYMCGLEIFGPYDMCDEYKGNGQNQYDCVGQLTKFRQDHQRGQGTISQAIRNKLKGRFKGAKEDAFVVIYHARCPYNNVYSYRAEDKKSFYHLEFSSNDNECQFLYEDFDDSYRLSQLTSVNIKPHILYGYIHHLGDKKVRYDTTSKCFSFPKVQ